MTIPNHQKAKETNGLLAFWMKSLPFHSPRTSQKCNETSGFVAFTLQGTLQPSQNAQTAITPMGF